MRKTIAYIAMSVDGYISDNNNTVSWLSGDNSNPEDNGSYPTFIETIDTVILGYTTYHQIVNELSPEEWSYKGKHSYVLTHRPLENKEDITFTNISIEELSQQLQLCEGKDIWLCGGASIINQYHALNLIDEYCISMIPTILGTGTKLFNTHDKETKLELKSSRQYNGIVDLVYTKR